MEPVKASSRHCSIYTRKSSEEGLEQDFNSLQAQRGACEAFIKSQAGEGWRLVRTAYDDGGLSGGTNGFATRLRPPNAKGCGWALSFHSGRTSATGAL